MEKSICIFERNIIINVRIEIRPSAFRRKWSIHVDSVTEQLLLPELQEPWLTEQEKVHLWRWRSSGSISGGNLAFAVFKHCSGGEYITGGTK